MAERQTVREVAMEVFDECLTGGMPELFTEFINEQIVRDPACVDLLEDVAEELHQRLIGLRERLFSERSRLIETAMRDYQIDLSLVTPAHLLDDYHLLDVEAVVELVKAQGRVAPDELDVLRRLTQSSLRDAAQFQGDALLTRFVLDYVLDWADALSVGAVQAAWDAMSWYRPARQFIQ